jgi:hypothetical protein
MFANHFTGDPEPIRKNKSKYNLAKKTFEQVFELTVGDSMLKKFTSQIYVTKYSHMLQRERLSIFPKSLQLMESIESESYLTKIKILI